MSKRYAQGLIPFLALAFLLVTIPSRSLAQSTTGSISGIVRDGRATPIPDAIINITNSANAVSRNATTSASGFFISPQLPPGSYTIGVEKAGFRKLVRTDLTLTTGRHLSVGVLVLETGESSAQSESQATDAGQLELQSTSGERSGLLTKEEIRDLSLLGRNMLALVTILPGVISDGPSPGLGALHINGARGNQYELTIDGSSDVDTGSNATTHLLINPDGVSEVNVLSANYPAEYGRSAGGFIQFVTPSGTQDFHGSARFFHRHEGLNANSYFRNAEGRNPDGSEIQPRPIYRFNDFGYAWGGPVMLGRWNENKNKLFFYWNQEFHRQVVASGGARNIRVPSEAERRGDFSQTLDGSGARIFIRDPNRAGNCGVQDQSACFPGNVIPPARFFQYGQAILNLYPSPNFPGENKFNYTSSLSGTLPRREDILRLDYKLRERTRISVRYIGYRDSQLAPYGAGNFPLSNIVTSRSARNGAISLLHMFSPTLSNEFIFGPGTNRIVSTAEDEKATRLATGIAFPMLFPNVNDGDYIPTFGYGMISNVTALPNANFNSLPARNVNHTFDFRNNLSKVSGSHLIKTGVFVQRSRKDRTTGTPIYGNINFSLNANNPLNTGHPFANALLGGYSMYQQASSSPFGFYRYTNVEGFVQDNWRVTPRLTLDFGLRLSWYQPQYESRLQTGVFNPALFDRSKAVRLYDVVRVGNQDRAVDPANRPAVLTLDNTLSSNLIGAIVLNSGDIANGIGRTSQSYPRGGFDNTGLQWGPRFGFAYDLFGRGRTVARGGFGIAYDRVAGDLSIDMLLNPPAILTPALFFGRLQDLAGAGGTLAPPNVFGFARAGRIPAIYSFSLGIQREIGFGTAVDVAYVGTLSRHLPQTRNLNAIPYGTTFTREAQDPSRFPGGVVPQVEDNLPAAYRDAGLQFSGANAKRVEFLRPFPGYGNIMYREFAGSSNYNSLQVAVNRRFAERLHFSLSYTWSKTLVTANTDAETTHPFDTRRYDYRLASFDRRHVFGGGFVFDTPKLSRYLGDRSLARAVFDDWKISGIAALISGPPVELGVSITGTNAGQRITGSYTEGPRFYLSAPPQPGPNGLLIDPAAIAISPIGNVGPWPRQYLRGPGTNNQDIAIFKNFPLANDSEQYLQLRIEMFNAFNHTQFSSINTTTNLSVPNAAGGFTTGNAIFDAYSRVVITNFLRPAGSSEPLGRYFGEYNNAGSGRIIQLAIKLHF